MGGGGEGGIVEDAAARLSRLQAQVGNLALENLTNDRYRQGGIGGPANEGKDMPRHASTKWLCVLALQRVAGSWQLWGEGPIARELGQSALRFPRGRINLLASHSLSVCIMAFLWCCVCLSVCLFSQGAS